MSPAKTASRHKTANAAAALTGAPEAGAENPIWLCKLNEPWGNMLSRGQKVLFKPKEFLPPTQNGQPGFYYLKYGRARLAWVGAHGGETTVCHIGEGTLLHDTSPQSCPQCRAYAITPLETWFFSSAECLTPAFAVAHPELLLNLLDAQTRKNIYFMRRLASIAGEDAFGNTCGLMLDLVRCHGSLEVPLGITHEEIATLLCVRRSWLCKILRRLRDEGVIARCTKSRLEVLDLDKLTAYANGGKAGGRG